jgi:PhnB protein
MQVQSYLMFNGRTEEAIEFYKKALGAQVEMILLFKDAPEGQCPPALADKVMHSSFKIGDTVVMASDGMCSGDAKLEFKGISLTLNPKTEAECERLFNALAESGSVQQPLIKTFFSPKFGVVSDKFGVTWMVLVDQQMASQAA